MSKEALEEKRVKLIKGKKRCNCKLCDKLILSNDWKYIATEGVYCFYDGRIKSLHDGAIKWIKGNFL